MKRPFRTAMLSMMSLIAGCATLPAPDRAHGGFVEREVRVDGQMRRYQVFVPSRTAGGTRPAVVLFLHGSGERGSDGVRQTQAGLGPYVRAHAADFPALAIFPQIPEPQEWSDNAALALAALDAAVREFGGDPYRVYLTGLSMGGYGTWDLALMQPRRFAALVPICAGVEPLPERPTLRVQAVLGEPDPFAAAARRLRDTPIWIFHGAKDEAVPPEQSRKMAAALQTAGAKNARYTEFPEAGHNAWDPAYATPELWTWLFAQRR